MTSSSSLSATLSVLAGKSDSETEELLDRMLTRLALCDDEKLQDLLSKLLPISIAALSTSSQLVRNKVLEILNHVNKRTKNQSNIKLPLMELWNLYSESSSASMVRNFCIVYIEMAIDRVSKEEKEHLLPSFLGLISKLPSQHQEVLLRISAKVIGECYAIQASGAIAKDYKNLAGSQDIMIFLEFGLHTLLYQPTSNSEALPQGLSITQRDRVRGNKVLTADAIRARKLGILNFTEAMELSSELVYPLYLVASADSQESVAKRGEELVKKNAGVNFDEANLISKIFLLFNGNTGLDHIPQESRVHPGSPALRVRLMSVFCRSISAANSFPLTLQCIFGCFFGNNTSSRLKQLGMEFTVWVFKHARADQLRLMGPVILTGIVNLLENHSTSEQDATLRETKSFSFQAIGLLAERMPELFRDKIDMARRLFNALKLEAPSLRPVIQEATNSLSLAYKDSSLTVLKSLEQLLFRNFQEEISELRFCAVRWATSLFDLQHCPSRFICMVAAADSRLDIREMALEGLFPGEDQRKNVSKDLNLKYPKLAAMVDFIVEQKPALLNSTPSQEMAILFPSETYLPMIKFLLRCFEADVKHYAALEDSDFAQTVEKMLLLLENAMTYEGSVQLHGEVSKALMMVAGHVPKVVASRYAEKLSWLKQLLGHVDFGTREAVARLLGLASSAVNVSSSSDMIFELSSSISGTVKLRFEMQHGLICALGYVTANSLIRTPPISGAVLQTAVKCLVDLVNSEDPTLASAAMQALGHIGLCVPLPLLPHDSSSVTVLYILREKLAKLLLRDDIKAVQRIVIALGHMCAKESSFALISIALDVIFSLSRSKVEDILFAAGEALAFLWGGVPTTADVVLRTNYSSLSTISNFLMEDMSSSLSSSTHTGSEVLEVHHVDVRDAITRKLFDELLYSNKKEERCAGTVWLLSLTMYCGHNPSIQQLLPDIQDAFSHLLGEEHELTQELASQGLSVVYELGDSTMKKSLVNALVGTLTGSGKRKRAVKLVEDSEVFQEGVLGESLTGGKLSTYKELCNLANEMGQPDLIYKFMDLANYQVSLNSKRGAAFGFSKIAKHAGDALLPHLRSLIPRLVRYQYDPDKNVQDSMAHIWKSLVADSKRTIDENLELIFDDLLIQCGSRLWRSREASCLALADIIQGRKFDQVGKHLGKIWRSAFRAMDDIKETVRNSGDRLCRSLTSLTVRLCDISLTQMSEAQKTMDIVLPLLLTEGIMSKVDSIRKASIGILAKVVKGSGVAIRPHLPELVSCMLESLSSLEDQGLNYVELHAANAGIHAEKLEQLRISIAKSSPMWGTLDFCVEVVDNQSLEVLVPRLAQLVRSGVGLNTRVGIANFISLLVQKIGADIKPFTSMLLKLLFPVVKEEKSAASRRAFANACAILLKFSAPSQAHKLLDDTVALHAGDRNDQVAGAVLLKSYSSMANEVLSGYRAQIMPVIFLSRFEDDKSVSSLYEELWDDNVSSEQITLELYVGEIVTLVTEGIMSSSWANKKKAALAIGKLSEILGKSLSPHHHVLLTSIMKEIPGRLWEGKDALLNALSALCAACHEAIFATDPDAPTAILDFLLSACNKKVKDFREAAFSCLEQTIKAFNNPDFFGVVFPPLYEMCKLDSSAKPGQSAAASDARADAEEPKNSSPAVDKVVSCITACVHVARVNDILEQRRKLLDIFIFCLSPTCPWTVKLAIFSSIKELTSKLHKYPVETQDPSLNASVSVFFKELFEVVLPKVLECMHIIKIGQVHVAASDCLLDVIEMYKATQAEKSLKRGIKAELLQLHEVEKNEAAKFTLGKCLEVLETLEEASI